MIGLPAEVKLEPKIKLEPESESDARFTETKEEKRARRKREKKEKAEKQKKIKIFSAFGKYQLDLKIHRLRLVPGCRNRSGRIDLKVLRLSLIHI